MPFRPYHALALFLLITSLGLLACSGGESVPESCPTPAPNGGSGATFVSPSTTELNVGVISTDVCTGPNRLAFFLLDSESETVSVPEVDVSTYYPAEGSGAEIKQVAKARFHRWPLGELGVYSIQANFDQAGSWGLQVAVAGPDGSTRYGQAVFQVKENSATPAIGSSAPLSKSKTIRDVTKLSEITTARPPDPELYSLTIAEAVARGLPLVVVFATPAFCQTATCGPQVQVVEGIKDRYRDRANFIHVEIFDNPQEVQGDLSEARNAPAVMEWGLPTEPWTFIVDSSGRIASKFEAFTTEEEIEEELKKVLR